MYTIFALKILHGKMNGMHIPGFPEGFVCPDLADIRKPRKTLQIGLPSTKSGANGPSFLLGLTHQL